MYFISTYSLFDIKTEHFKLSSVPTKHTTSFWRWYNVVRLSTTPNVLTVKEKELISYNHQVIFIVVLDGVALSLQSALEWVHHGVQALGFEWPFVWCSSQRNSFANNKSSFNSGGVFWSLVGSAEQKSLFGDGRLGNFMSDKWSYKLSCATR